MEELPGGPSDPADFACGPANLVIGVGGEGLAIVAKSLAKAVGYFIEARLGEQDDLASDEWEPSQG